MLLLIQERKDFPIMKHPLFKVRKGILQKVGGSPSGYTPGCRYKDLKSQQWREAYRHITILHVFRVKNVSGTPLS